MATLFKEYHISTNDFDEPKITTGKKAIGVLLVRLFLLEPGTDPARPEMGIGLASRYRYLTQDCLTELNKEIQNQIRTYLAPFSTLDVTLKLSNKTLYITTVIDNTVYNFVTEEQEGNRVTLTELQGGITQ